MPTAGQVARGRRGTFLTSSTDREAGFTLLEVIIVMCIIALVASLAVSLTPGTGRARLKALTLETAALLRRERLGAIFTGRAHQVSIDYAARALIGDGGDIVPIPSDVVLDVLAVDDSSFGRLSAIRFEPDGASSGGVLKLSLQKAEYEVRVNWYTGAIAIFPE